MNMMKKHRKIYMIESLLLVCVLLLSIIPSPVFSDNNVWYNVFPEDEHENNYSKDEAVIVLSDYAQSEIGEIYGIYSDDYISINSNAGTTIAGSPDAIESLLELDFDVSEFRVLNKSNDSTAYNTYSISDTGNNICFIKSSEINVGDMLEKLRSNDYVEIAEPNYKYDLHAVPNDPEYDLQYALDLINAEDAWNITTGSNSVVVGIIDTGIQGNHPDLQNHIWVNNYYNTTTQSCQACGREDDTNGYNFSGFGNFGNPVGGFPTDSNGHGTNVAGIIGACTNNNDGIAGINWNIKLAWLGAYDGSGHLSLYSIIDAINYAQNHNIQLINCSFGCSQYSKTLYKMMSLYNGLIIASTGKTNINIDNNHIYPAAYDLWNIVSVTSTGETNQLTSSSPYGPINVDVAAPGDSIYTTTIYSENDFASGTSMSAAIVTGIAALIKSANPTFNYKQIKAAICNTVQSMNKNYQIKYDGGIVDAYAALQVTSSDLCKIILSYNYSGSQNNYVEYVPYGSSALKTYFVPSRPGYVFNGWYTSSNGNTLFDFNSLITSTQLLYAHWDQVIPNSFADLFPDDNFRDAIISLLNTNDNGSRQPNSIVSSSDISFLGSIDELDVSNLEINSLDGLEYFENLESLICSHNNLTNLDLTNLGWLNTLDCSYNELTSLDLSSTPDITNINCSHNVIRNIIYPTYTNGPHILICNNNELSALYASFAWLEVLDCSYNNLIYLNINSTNRLRFLNCSNNNLSELNTPLSFCIEYLNCSHNFLTQIGFGTTVIEGDCSFNNLTSIYIPSINAIQRLYCNNNSLTLLNTTELSSLYRLDISKNELNDLTDVLSSFCTPSIQLLTYNTQNGWENCPFSDIPNGYIKAIEYVYKQGFISGTTPTTFSPNNNVTRAMSVETLYNMAGCPDVSQLTIPFNDVSSNASYYNAVKWAYNNGITSGTSPTTFSPNNGVTRVMITVMLNKYAQYLSYTPNLYRDYEVFDDESQIASWAKTSVKKMYKAGIINPYDDGTGNVVFAPSVSVTRAELALLVRKFDMIRIYN
ncbi:MAG: S8 family serine peptidase [Clostridia bacterium]|nr:S8 family serine peptidase [Clostridia bacterium]